MTDIYAKVPQSKPDNAAVYQLKPVELNGNNFYGWKMLFYKQVPSGNKTKDGRIKYKSVIDPSKPIVYDSTTQQMMANHQNSSALSSILLNEAKQSMQNKQQSSINSQLMLKLANQLLQNKQQNKVNSQLMMQIANLEVQLKPNK